MTISDSRLGIRDWGFTAIFFAAILSLGAWQQKPAGTDEILKREQARVDALVSGKIDRIAAMLSPTLTYTHSSGAMDTREPFLESLRSGRVAYKALKHRDLEARLLSPDVAILTGVSDILVAIAGKDTDVPVRFTIVYVRKKGEWLMESWHSTRRPPS
jgi:hypothetical protein